MGLLGPRLHRTFVTPLTPARCAFLLGALGDTAPPLGDHQLAAAGWTRVGLECRVEGDRFTLAVGSREQFERRMIGLWAADGRLRARPDGTLIELRMRPRSKIGHPSHRHLAVAFAVGLAVVLADAAGWVPGGRVTDYALVVARLALLLPLVVPFTVLWLRQENRGDPIGHVIATTLYATEHPPR